MSDLVKRLRDGCNLQQRDGERAADLIEQLEADLASAAKADPMTATSIILGREIVRLEAELAEEKALADRLCEAARAYYRREEVSVRDLKLVLAIEEYRKARGL